MKLFRRVCRKICYVFNRKIPDKPYIQMMYYVKLGKKINLKKPVMFNEKLNWLKLYDRNPQYTKLADKYEVRNYVKDMIGEEYLVPLLGVWDSAEEIPYEKLPERFVLKCTHDSASVIICKDKDKFDRTEANEKLNKCLKTNYYWASREWPYKNIRPRIVAEQYMEDESHTELKDYKIYCFGGKPALIQVDFGRFVHHERNLYDTSWNYINERFEYPNNPEVQIKKPECLEEMLILAAKLSGRIPSVRIDFYSVNNRPYFGEITFYQEGGYGRFSSEEFERKLGQEILLK